MITLISPLFQIASASRRRRRTFSQRPNGMSMDECGMSLLRRVMESTNDEDGTNGVPVPIEYRDVENKTFTSSA